jgi:hypothetical protein
MVSLNEGGHHTVTKTGTLRTMPVEGHGDDPPLSLRDILILSPHKFADVAGNLMLMTLPTEIGLRLVRYVSKIKVEIVEWVLLLIYD